MGGKPDLMSGEDAIYYQTIQTVDGQTVRVNLTTESNTTKKCIPVSTKPIIPVVFIPGMMTTYLRDRRTKKVAWSPPSGILPSIGALLSHLVKRTVWREACYGIPNAGNFTDYVPVSPPRSHSRLINFRV